MKHSLQGASIPNKFKMEKIVMNNLIFHLQEEGSINHHSRKTEYTVRNTFSWQNAHLSICLILSNGLRFLALHRKTRSLPNGLASWSSPCLVCTSICSNPSLLNQCVFNALRSRTERTGSKIRTSMTIHCHHQGLPQLIKLDYVKCHCI